MYIGYLLSIASFDTFKAFPTFYLALPVCGHCKCNRVSEAYILNPTSCYVVYKTIIIF